MKVTRKHAEQVVEAIKAAFPAYVQEFKKDDGGFTDYDELVPVTDPQMLPTIVENDGRFEIVWESGSPYCWSYNFPHGGRDEEFGGWVKDVSAMIPNGIFVEAATQYSVAVCEA